VTEHFYHHAATPRNRKKALHHAENLSETLVHFLGEHIKHQANIEYMIGRAARLVDRLKAEVDHDDRHRD